MRLVPGPCVKVVGLVGFIVVTTGGLVGVVTLLIVVLGGCVTVRIGLLVTTPCVGGVGRETLRTGGGFFLTYWAPSVVVTSASFDVCANACGDACVATATANAAIKMLVDVRIKKPLFLFVFRRARSASANGQTRKEDLKPAINQCF